MCTNTRAIWEREKRYLHDIHLFATVTIKWHFYYRGSKRKIADRYEPKKKTANCEQWIATFQLEAIVFISISIECRAFFLFRFSISFSFFLLHCSNSKFDSHHQMYNMRVIRCNPMIIHSYRHHITNSHANHHTIAPVLFCFLCFFSFVEYFHIARRISFTVWAWGLLMLIGMITITARTWMMSM